MLDFVVHVFGGVTFVCIIYLVIEELIQNTIQKS